MSPALPWVLAACVALTAVFAAYLHPEFMLTVATQLWSCF